MGFGLDCSRFARCYYGNPVWFLFHPLLRCFRSGGPRSVKEHPTPKSRMRSLIQASPVLWLHAPTRGVSPLAAPFFSFQAEPFSRRRSMLGHGGIHWRLVNTFSYVCVADCLCAVSFEFLLGEDSFTLHSAFQRMGSCMLSMACRVFGELS